MVCNMAAKKKPASSSPRSANSAEKDMMDKKAKNRTDPSGRSGLGASTAPIHWKQGDATYNAAKKVLESRGIDPMKYSSNAPAFKGKKPIYDYLEANTPKQKFLSGKSSGMKGLFKSTPDKAAYSRISSEMRGINSKGQIVNNNNKKKK